MFGGDDDEVMVGMMVFVFWFFEFLVVGYLFVDMVLGCGNDDSSGGGIIFCSCCAYC